MEAHWDRHVSGVCLDKSSLHAIQGLSFPLQGLHVGSPVEHFLRGLAMVVRRNPLGLDCSAKDSHSLATSFMNVTFEGVEHMSVFFSRVQTN